MPSLATSSTTSPTTSATASPANRTLTRCVVALSAAVTIQLVASTAAAQPICDRRNCAEGVLATSHDGAPAPASPYSGPLSALGGRTLAQVLSDHVETSLGPFTF